MRDADEAIDRLMAGLREAEPSPGMKRRIFEAMETHDAISSGPHWRRMITPWPLGAPVAASVVCAVIAAASWIVITLSHTPANMVSQPTRAAVRQGAQPETVVHKAPIAPRRVASSVPRRLPRDLPAGSVMQSAGYPAPPLPLTEQEKMLLRVAQRNDAQNKALLNPELQAAQSAKNTEQFQHFFEINAEEMRSQSE